MVRLTIDEIVSELVNSIGTDEDGSAAPARLVGVKISPNGNGLPSIIRLNWVDTDLADDWEAQGVQPY